MCLDCVLVAGITRCEVVVVSDCGRRFAVIPATVWRNEGWKCDQEKKTNMVIYSDSILVSISCFPASSPVVHGGAGSYSGRNSVAGGDDGCR